MKRKLIALAVAVIFVLGTVAPGLAAQPDVVGTEFEEAAGKLAAIGVMSGFPDGEFKPDENITRAQFAAIAVRAYDLETAAQLSMGATQFNDVPADHWASGYINVAAQRGLIQGYGDGNFGPEDQLTYAQAITILVRLVGLGPVVEKEGTWPANYIGRAANEGILKGVSVAGSGSALRGVVAEMLVNTIEDVTVWEASGYNADGSVDYTDSGRELLASKIEVTAADEVLVAGYDVEDNELNLTGAKITNGWYEVAADINLYEAYLNEVTVWVNDDDEVIFLQIDSDYYIDAVETGTAVAAGDDITLIEADKDLELAGGFIFDLNDTGVGVIAPSTEYDFAKVVLDNDGEVAFIDAYTWTDAFVVADYDDFLVTDYDGDEMDLEDYVLFKDGKLMDADDIEVDDILFLNTTAEFGEVFNKTVVGPVDEYYTQRFEVDGEAFAYTTTYNRNTQYFDADDELDNFAYDEAKDMEEEGADVTVYADRKGDAVLVLGEMAETVSDTFAVYLTEDIIAWNDGRRDNLEIEGVNEMGAEVLYEFRLSQLEEVTVNGTALWDDSMADLEIDAGTGDIEPLLLATQVLPIATSGSAVLNTDAVFAGNIIEVTVDADGDVIELNWFTGTFDEIENTSTTYELALDDKYFDAETAGNKKLASDVVVFDVTDDNSAGVLGHDADDIVATTWGALSGFEIEGAVAVTGLPNAIVYFDGSDAEYVVVAKTTSEDTTEYKGILVQERTDDSNELTRIKMLIDGEVETFYVNTDKYSETILAANVGDNYGKSYVIEVDDSTDMVIAKAPLAINEGIAFAGGTQRYAEDVVIADNEVVTSDDGAGTAARTLTLVSDGYIIDATDTTDVKVITLRELRDMITDGDAFDVDVIVDAAGTDYAKFIIIYDDILR